MTNNRSTGNFAFYALIAFVVIIGTFMFTQGANAQMIERDPFVVGTEMTPPFSMGDESEWEGLSARLWEEISNEIDVEYTVRDAGTLSDLISDVSSGQVDVAVASMTITSEREESLDFTHAFFTTGISIATKADGVSFGQRIMSIVRNFPMKALFNGIIVLCSALFIVGFFFVLIEGRKHTLLSEMSWPSRLFHGWYWAAVTNTTTGYGVYAPESIPGKVYGVFWMYTSMLITSSLIAGLAYVSFNVANTSGIENLSDLVEYRVVTVENSTSSSFLTDEGIEHSTCAGVYDCMTMLSDGSVDAVVYDRPVLQYYANSEFENLSVLDEVYDEQSYGFALPAGSPHVEEINRALLREIDEEWWKEAQEDILGEQ